MTASLSVMIAFCVWFVATVAVQVPGPWRRTVMKLAHWSLLPYSRYFAPEPIDVDYHLVFRDVLADGTAGAWQEIPLAIPRWHALLFDLSKREQKTVMDMASELCRLMEQVAPACRCAERIILISQPYLYFLHLVNEQPRSARATHRHYMLVQTTGFGDERQLSIAVTSELHALEPSASSTLSQEEDLGRVA